MKRWNHKGTHAANTRMAELRLRKLEAQRSDLITQWEQATGCSDRSWYEVARQHLTPSSEPMEPTARVSECIAWLQSAITRGQP